MGNSFKSSNLKVNYFSLLIIVKSYDESPDFKVKLTLDDIFVGAADDDNGSIFI